MTLTEDTTSPDIDEGQLREWLLHRLPASTRDALEERLLRDDALSAALLDVEYGLFDALARGELTAADAAAVTAHLLPGSTGHARSRFARSLAALERMPFAHDSARRTRAVPRALAQRRWQIGLLATASLLVAIAITSLWLRMPADPAAPQAMPTITLLADLSRGSRGLRASVPAGTTAVRLQLEVLPVRDDDVYRLTIGDGAERHVVDDLVARRTGAYAFIETVVPAGALHAGANRIVVQAQGGTEADAQQWTLEIGKVR